MDCTLFRINRFSWSDKSQATGVRTDKEGGAVVRRPGHALYPGCARREPSRVAGTGEANDSPRPKLERSNNPTNFLKFSHQTPGDVLQSSDLDSPGHKLWWFQEIHAPSYLGPGRGLPFRSAALWQKHGGTNGAITFAQFWLHASRRQKLSARFEL